MAIAWKRILFFCFAAGCGAAGSFWGQPLIHGNEQAVGIIVTTFSILAGFLVAIMTIMGDPGTFSGRSWRANELNHKNIFNRLARQKWMFTLYLVTLGLIFFASLIGEKCSTIVLWVEYLYLGTAITAFILSLGLPSALMKIQLSRHEEIIKSKRKASGIKE